jgi:hypothetical protein
MHVRLGELFERVGHHPHVQPPGHHLPLADRSGLVEVVETTSSDMV